MATEVVLQTKLKPLVVNLNIPPKLAPLYDPYRYKVLHGGRGSAKSYTVADFLICKALARKVKILCTREIQASLTDSVLSLLEERIYDLGLINQFKIYKNRILCKKTGSTFIFKGLRNNPQEIKSTQGVDYCWVEEAERVSQESWNVLTATIRRPDSEIIITFNPEYEQAPTYQKFIVNTPPNCLIIQINYMDNPWFPEVLRQEMEYDKANDLELYEWKWLGTTRVIGNHIIFKDKFVVEEFVTPAYGVRHYYGVDWGFANDALTMVRCHIIDDVLYIDYEAFGLGIESDYETTAFFDLVPGSRSNKSIADNQMPSRIAQAKRLGFNMHPCEKYPGSIEDGIEYIKHFKRIVIHPRCKHVRQEFNTYAYKRDPKTDEILPIPLDKNNHTIDAIRYALGELMPKYGLPITNWGGAKQINKNNITREIRSRN